MPMTIDNPCRQRHCLLIDISYPFSEVAPIPHFTTCPPQRRRNSSAHDRPGPRWELASFRTFVPRGSRCSLLAGVRQIGFVLHDKPPGGVGRLVGPHLAVPELALFDTAGSQPLLVPPNWVRFARLAPGCQPAIAKLGLFGALACLTGGSVKASGLGDGLPCPSEVNWLCFVRLSPPAAMAAPPAGGSWGRSEAKLGLFVQCPTAQSLRPRPTRHRREIGFVSHVCPPGRPVPLSAGVRENGLIRF
jgi:hypothetical protein